jgi:hypothetical protein
VPSFPASMRAVGGTIMTGSTAGLHRDVWHDRRRALEHGRSCLRRVATLELAQCQITAREGRLARHVHEHERAIQLARELAGDARRPARRLRPVDSTDN